MSTTDDRQPRGRKGRTGTVTLQQIAREVGLPLMTVSRALRNLPGEVSTETRARVMAVAERLRYRPNLLVQGIQTGRTRNIGVVVPATSEFCCGLIRGIHDGLVAEDWLPILDWQHGDPASVASRDGELQVIHRLLDRRVDGVILFPADAWVADLHFEEVWTRQIPIVTVDHRMQRATADFVGTDDALGGRLAAGHLLDLGHRRIAHLAGNQRFPSYAERCEGFVAALTTAGATCVVEECPGEDASAIQAVARRLLGQEPRPTAIYCASDHFALELYALCRDLGVRIPEDVSIVGYADLQTARHLTPPLTTIRQDPIAIGRQAATLVIAQCRDGRRTDGPRSVRLAPELIVRGSTRARA